VNKLEPAQLTPEQRDQLELALRSVYPDGGMPTLGEFRKDPARLASLEHLLEVLGETLPERQHDVLVRTLGLQKATAETLETVGRELSVTRERVRAIGKQALVNLRKAALASGMQKEITLQQFDNAEGLGLELYQGNATDRAVRWASLPSDDLRRLAITAAQARDAEALWNLTDAYLTLHGAKGSAVSERTRDSYRRGIRDLLADWAGENLLRPARDAGVVWVRQLETRVVRDPLTGEPKRDAVSGGPRVLSPATVQAKLAAARALYKALRWAGVTTASPFENVKVVKDPVPAWEKRGAYTPEEVEALIEVAEGADRVMVLLGAHAGLRIAEMAALRWPDVDWRSKELVVRQGKGGKTARVAMTRRLRETLHECPRDAADLKGFVLPFRAYRARERFQKLCLLSGVEYKGKEVHGLRHGAGTRTYVQFKDLGRVAQHLRQASVDTARRYAKMADKVVGEGIEDW
jgi:integrase/recombinase XerC